MTAVVGIVLSLVTLGILLYHLWEHRTEAEKKRIRDSFPEREKLAAEYGRLVGYPTKALVGNELIEVHRAIVTDYLTPEEIQDKITQIKADRYNSIVKANEELRIEKDWLSKQVEVLSRPVTGQDQEAVIGDVRYYISTSTTASKKRKKKK